MTLQPSPSPSPAKVAGKAPQKPVTLVHRNNSGAIAIDYWQTVLALNGVAVPMQKHLSIRYTRGTVPWKGFAGKDVQTGIALLTPEMCEGHNITLEEVIASLRKQQGSYGVNFVFLEDEEAMAKFAPQLLAKWAEEEKLRASPEFMEIISSQLG